MCAIMCYLWKILFCVLVKNKSCIRRTRYMRLISWAQPRGSETWINTFLIVSLGGQDVSTDTVFWIGVSFKAVKKIIPFQIWEYVEGICVYTDNMQNKCAHSENTQNEVSPQTGFRCASLLNTRNKSIHVLRISGIILFVYWEYAEWICYHRWASPFSPLCLFANG